MTERPAKLKLYDVSAQALVSLFHTGNVTRITHGIPTDARLVESGYDRERGVFQVVVEHESFDVVHEGEEMPKGNIEAEQGVGGGD